MMTNIVAHARSRMPNTAGTPFGGISHRVLTRSLVAGALMLAAIGAPAAMAHEALISSSPAAGSVVRVLPATVSMTFGGTVGAVRSVRVLDAHGRNHAVSARIDRRSASRVVVRTKHPVAGSYRVVWKIVSVDGHPQAGTFRFRAAR